MVASESAWRGSSRRGEAAGEVSNGVPVPVSFDLIAMDFLKLMAIFFCCVGGVDSRDAGPEGAAFFDDAPVALPPPASFDVGEPFFEVDSSLPLFFCFSAVMAFNLVIARWSQEANLLASSPAEEVKEYSSSSPTTF